MEGLRKRLAYNGSSNLIVTCMHTSKTAAKNTSNVDGHCFYHQFVKPSNFPMDLTSSLQEIQYCYNSDSDENKTVFFCDSRPLNIDQNILKGVSNMQKTALRSYRKTSWRHFFLCWRVVASRENMCTIFYSILEKRKHCLYIEHPVEFSSKKLMRYRELCIDAQHPSNFFQNKWHSVLFWDKN
jgi:hypothetical protein